MRKSSLYSILLAVLVWAILIPSMSFANTYTFTPGDADVMDLDHNYYYGWKISNTKSAAIATELATDYTIVSATLVFKNIYDWTYEANDILKTWLLSEPPPIPTGGSWIYNNSLWQKYDAQNGSTINWGMGIESTMVGTWTDPYGDSYHKINLTFDFSDTQIAALISYISDGVFGFGFDPDCHYYNDGITFTVVTEKIPQVPEPTTMLLLGFGLVGLAGLRRKFRG